MERSRRNVSAPRRYDADDEFWVPSNKGKLRRVYRPLKRRDITKALAVHEVYLHWPEDGKWYRAHIEKLFFRRFAAYVHYPDDDSYEELDLKELIKLKHIAIIETRSINAKLRRGEMPVPEEGGNETAVEYLDSGSQSSDDVDSADWAIDESDLDDDGDDDDEMSDDADEVDVNDPHGVAEAGRSAARMAPNDSSAALKHKQSMRQRQTSGSVPVSKRVRQNDPGRRPAGAQAPDGGGYPDKLAAALVDKMNGVMAGPRINSPAGGPSTSTPVTQLVSGSVTKLPGAEKPSDNKQPQQSDAVVRGKVEEQLTHALEVAVEELRKDGAAGPGDAVLVGKNIEAALFDVSGKVVSKEYKNKFRSLVFNLKDAANPDLRARVLLGELSADKLVRMTALELASRDLSAWRLAKTEEFSKGKFLDVETAAKFSTAAAAQLADRRRAALAAIAPDKAGALATEIANAARNPDMPPDALRALADSLLAAESVPGPVVFPSGGDQGPVGAQQQATHVAGSEQPEHAASFAAAGSVELPRLASLQPEHLAATDMRDGADQRKVTLAPAEPQAAGSAAGDDYDPDDFADDVLDDLSAPVGQLSSGPSSGAHVNHSNVPDLAPIVGHQDEPAGALHKQGVSLRPGDQVWQGTVLVPESPELLLRVCYIAGMGDLSTMLGSSVIEVKGTVRLEKFEPFLEELRTKSKSRTVTLGVVRLPPASTTEQGVLASSELGLSELAAHYSEKERTGVCHPLPGLEGYLMGQGHLARRLIHTARGVTPPHLAHLLPATGDVGDGELLLAMIHRKDFVAKPRLGVAVTASQARPHSSADLDSQALPSPGSMGASGPGTTGGRPNDPRSRVHDPRLRAATGPPATPAHVPAAAASAAQPAAEAPAPVQSPDLELNAGIAIDLSGLSALAASLGIPPSQVVQQETPPPPPPPPPAEPVAVQPASPHQLQHVSLTGVPPLIPDFQSGLSALAATLGISPIEPMHAGGPAAGEPTPTGVLTLSPHTSMSHAAHPPGSGIPGGQAPAVGSRPHVGPPPVDHLRRWPPPGMMPTEQLLTAESRALLSHVMARLDSGPHSEHSPPHAHGPLGPLQRSSPAGPYGIPAAGPASAGPYPDMYEAEFGECVREYDAWLSACAQHPPHTSHPQQQQQQHHQQQQEQHPHQQEHQHQQLQQQLVHALTGPAATAVAAGPPGQAASGIAPMTVHSAQVGAEPSMPPPGRVFPSGSPKPAGQRFAQGHSPALPPAQALPQRPPPGPPPTSRTPPSGQSLAGMALAPAGPLPPPAPPPPPPPPQPPSAAASQHLYSARTPPDAHARHGSFFGGGPASGGPLPPNKPPPGPLPPDGLLHVMRGNGALGHIQAGPGMRFPHDGMSGNPNAGRPWQGGAPPSPGFHGRS